MDGSEVRVLQLLQGVMEAVRNMLTMEQKVTKIELVHSRSGRCLHLFDYFEEVPWITREDTVDGRVSE